MAQSIEGDNMLKNSVALKLLISLTFILGAPSLQADTNQQSPAKETKLIPGLKKSDHMGLTVPDADQAVQFFEDFFGAIELKTITNLHIPGGWMTKNLNVPADAIIKKVAMLEIPGQFFLEIFEYKVKDQNTELPLNSDFGGHHLAFQVEDIEVAMKHLSDKGIKVLGDAKTQNVGPFDIKWVYFLTPWGTSLELIERI